MQELIKYITAPETIVSLLVFVFGLGAIWSSLNSRVKALEKEVEEMKAKLDQLSQIQQILSRMEGDIDRIKKTMQK